MTEDLKTRIAKEAEEKYPYAPTGTMILIQSVDREREIHIEAATLWAERLEAVRDEVEQKRGGGMEVSSTSHQIRNQGYQQAVKELLSIINKHLNQ